MPGKIAIFFLKKSCNGTVEVGILINGYHLSLG